jgi:hypothetical protein
MFEALRRSVPAVETMDSTSDRHILMEAAQHIHQLADEGRDLERGVMQLRIENLRLRLSQVAPDSSAAAALSAQLSAALCASEAVESNGHSLLVSDAGLPYGPLERPELDEFFDPDSPGGSSSSSFNDDAEVPKEVAKNPVPIGAFLLVKDDQLDATKFIQPHYFE